MSKHAKALSGGTESALKSPQNHIQLGMILPALAALVNRFPPISLYRELVAARNLITAYEAAAERQKGGQR